MAGGKDEAHNPARQVERGVYGQELDAWRQSYAAEQAQKKKKKAPAQEPLVKGPHYEENQRRSRGAF